MAVFGPFGPRLAPPGECYPAKSQGVTITSGLQPNGLHPFEKRFYRGDGPGTWANARLVRYADDFVVLARYQTARLVGWIEGTLEGRFQLTVNREKTRVVKMHQEGASLNFLGFTLRYDRDRYGRDKRYLNVIPSAKAEAHARGQLRKRTGPKQGHVPAPELTRGVSRWLRSWANYFDHGYPRHAFRKLNHFVVDRLTRHLKRRSQRPFRPPEGMTFYAQLQRFGLRLL